jgi:uncharacterized protein
MVLPAYAGALNAKDRHETALITGASSGIGLDLATLFAADRFDLILTARNKDKLEQLAQELQRQHGIFVHVIPGDLARPEAPQEIITEATRRGCKWTT